MTDINSVLLIGRLVRDSDLAYTSQGKPFAKFVVAVNRSRKEGEQWIDEVSFFDITIWGKQAETLKPYLQKGKQIAVDGYLKQDRWEKDGQNHSRVVVIANDVQLLGGGQPKNAQGESNSPFEFIPYPPVANRDFSDFDGGSIEEPILF